MNTSSEGLFKRILIPVDGSTYSLSAVRLGGRLAAINGSSLWILNVIDEEVEARICRLNRQQCEVVSRNMEEEARGLVADMKGELAQMGVDADTLIKRGSPHEIILETAEELGADLIVMGKLGRRGIKRILLGSVAERVIEFADCPILLSAGG